jgi:putative Mg2+ transporter-C (MgtC) family protein
MNFLAPESLALYWSSSEVSVNIIIFMNLVGALILGSIVGYERAYHGRAAGMRTYGLVCMASAGLVAISGYPSYWYAGQGEVAALSDPTRVIQGIVTGIGFLGAGVIMREGFSISGLTTAASIWSSSAIGVLVGVGFYPAAILLTILSASCMMWMTKVEGWLPIRQAVAIVLHFRKGFNPHEKKLREVALERGYELALGSLKIDSVGGEAEWRFVAVSLGKNKGSELSVLASELAQFEGVVNFHLAYARN